MKAIIHSERFSVSGLGSTGDKHTTPVGFETTVGAGIINPVLLFKLKGHVQYNAEPTGGAATLQVLAGSDVIHSEPVDASGAFTVDIDSSKIASAGTKLSVKFNVGTALATATTADVDAQIVQEQWMNVGNNC